nr:radical SAM protein [Candidatus Sigynarchaeota archaeon]
AILGPRDYHHIVAIVARIRAGERGIIQLEGSSIDTKGNLVASRRHRHIAILPIAEGCTGACHYCCTRFARGSLATYSLNHLVDNLQGFLSDGVTEIWITAEDCSAYVDRETGCNLGHLLNKLASLPGAGDRPYFLRPGMMNPATLLPVMDEVIGAYSSSRVFKLLHVPVQSGSDDVLQSMNRKYSSRDFTSIIDAFKKSYPTIMIATDVICGYPTETENDFEKTLDLIENTTPEIINISMYGHRPGTVASKLKPLDAAVVKARSKQITVLHERITLEKQARWIGWRGMAIIEEYNQSSKNWLCRTGDYRPVIVDDILDSEPGAVVQVEIQQAIRHYFKGTVLG